LQVHSREQYRLLLQGHLDERARREKRRRGVTGSDGVPRPRVENGHRRGLTSVFGSVRVTRNAYRAGAGSAAGPGTTSPTAAQATAQAVADPAPVGTAATAATAGNLHPADAVLNLPVGRHSAGLARLAAVEAARGSFDDAREAIERATGVTLGKAAGGKPRPSRGGGRGGVLRTRGWTTTAARRSTSGSGAWDS
jgi:hypothetical protein